VLTVTHVTLVSMEANLFGDAIRSQSYLSLAGDKWLTFGSLANANVDYQASLAIRDRLAKADPGNAGWQRDLSVRMENRRRAAGAGRPRRRVRPRTQSLSVWPKRTQFCLVSRNNCDWRHPAASRSQASRGVGKDPKGVFAGDGWHRQAPRKSASAPAPKKPTSDVVVGVNHLDCTLVSGVRP